MYCIPQEQVLRCWLARSSCICTRRCFFGWEGGDRSVAAFAFWLGEERTAGAEALCFSFACAWRLKSAKTGRRVAFAFISSSGGGGEERCIPGAGGGEEGGVDRAGASASSSEENFGCGLELHSGAETSLSCDEETHIISPSSLSIPGGETRWRLVGGSSS